MGRFLTSGNAASAASGALQALNTVATMAEAVVQGQILTLGADGKAYYAGDPTNNPYATNLRPIAQAITVYNALAVPATYVATGGALNSTTFSLSNGNTGFLYAQAANLYFAAVGVDGASVVQPVLLASDYASNATAIPLTGGGFAFIYVGASTYPKLGIYSNAGVQVSAPATVQSAASNLTNTTPQLCQIANGNVVVLFRTASTVGFAIYSPVGAVAVAPVTITFGATVTPCGAGFVVGYLSGGLYAAATFYSATGTAGATTTSSTTLSSSGATSAGVAPAVLSNGNVVVAGYSTNGTVTGVVAVIVAPTGAAVANNIKVFSGTATPVAQVLPTTDGGFIVFVGATALNAVRVNAAGAAIGATLLIDSAAGLTATGFIRAAIIADGSIVVAYTNIGTVSIVRITSAFTLAAAPVVLANGFYSDNPVIVPAQLSQPVPPYMSTFLIGGASSSVQYGMQLAIFASMVQPMTPIGVAAASAAQNSAVPVQYAGVATLSAAFKQPYAINAQSNSPPGQKMNVVGNSAILYGIQ